MSATYGSLFAGNIDFSLKTAASFLTADPASALAFARLGKELKRAEGRRAKAAEDGVEVPPLLSHGWLDALGEHDELVGVVFTNGTLFDGRRREWFSAHRHIIPTFSIAGDEVRTDARRGGGVYAKDDEAMRLSHAAQVPFSVSVTVTSQNIDSVLLDGFIEENLQKDCRLFVFVEYVPVEPGTEPLALCKADKKRLGDLPCMLGRS